MLPTVAVVFGKWFVVLEITLRTFPVEDVLCLLGELLVDVADPFFDALEMHGDAAASASPDPLFPSDLFGAYDAAHVMLAAFSLHKPRSIQLPLPLRSSSLLFGYVSGLVVVGLILPILGLVFLIVD